MAHDNSPRQREDAVDRAQEAPGSTRPEQPGTPDSSGTERDNGGRQQTDRSEGQQDAGTPGQPASDAADQPTIKQTAPGGPEQPGGSAGSPGVSQSEDTRSEPPGVSQPSGQPQSQGQSSASGQPGAVEQPSARPGESAGKDGSPWARPNAPTGPAPGASPAGQFSAGSAGSAGQQAGGAPGYQEGYQPTQSYPTYPSYPGGSGQPGYPSYSDESGQPGGGNAGGQGSDGGFRLFNQSTEQQPEQTGAKRRGLTRGKLVVGGLVLALLAALIGGGLGGLVGYQFAASGGHLSVLDDPLPDADSAAAPQGAVEAIAQRVLPSVVQLRVTTALQSDAGTGMVVSPDGLILTNNHVISMAATGGDLKVLFPDGRITRATIVGRDAKSDIAVVKAQNVSGLRPVILGNSDSVRVGQSVLAIGAPLALDGTVTTGIVSALNRAVSVGDDDSPPAPPREPGKLFPNPLPNTPLSPLPPSASAAPDQGEVLDAIQTDAAINPGNSGGPLLDIDGKVIGVNTAILSIGGGDGDQGGSVGLGFSIPINQVKRVAQELEQTGHSTMAVLGVQVQGSSRMTRLPDNPGVTLGLLTPGGAAQHAGLKQGDVVTKVDDRAVTFGDDLVAAIRSHAPGDRVTLTLSDGRSVPVILGSQPSG
jgi:putative serine protease PepD